MVYSHQPGLYADLCACLDAQGLRVVRCDLQPVGHLQMHRFWVVDNATAFKLEHSLLTPVSLAVRDAVVQPSIWKRTHGSGAGMVEANPNGATALRRQLSIRAPDRPGLIRDVSLSLVADKVDLETVVAHTAARPDGLVDAVFEATMTTDGSDSAQWGAGGASDAAWDEIALRATRAAELGMEASQAATPAQRGVITATLETHGRPTIAATIAAKHKARQMGQGGMGNAGVISRNADHGTGSSQLKRAESIADMSRFQSQYSQPSTPSPNYSTGLAHVSPGSSRSASPGHPHVPESPAPIHPRNANSVGHFANNNGSSLNRSYSVANMHMHGNITSGGSGGGRDAAELKGGADPFKPGMPQAIMHSASVADLKALGKAPTLSRLADPLQRASTPPIMGRDDMVIDEHEPIRRVESMLFGEKAFPVLPAPRRDRTTADYTLLRELGRGLCGTVYLGREKDGGRIVAFKVMRKSKLVDVGEARHASDERKLHEDISSGPFINRLLASFQDPWALFLVLEYAPCGDLFQAMNFHGLPSRNDAVIYAVQVATALEHMHNKGYVYRDLKPENILLHAHGSVQLADFGMAKKLAPGKRTNTVCGTAQYMSPEVLLHRGCSFEADLWAMGIFIYELTTGDTPFSSNSGSRQELYRRLMSHDPEQMTMANSVDRTTAAVVKGLLQNVESQRLGAGGNWSELYRQQWFHCVDVGAVQRGEVVPDLSPRRRNVINDPRLQQVLEQGDVPWQRGNIVEDPAVLALFENF